MWGQFEQSHEKLLIDIANEVKGNMFLSAEDIESVRGQVREKLVPLVEGMSHHYSTYRVSFQTHVAALFKRQLKLMIDLKMGQIGLDADDEKIENL